MGIPLEDNAADMIGKAQRGLGISDSQLAERAKLSAEQVRKLRDGKFDDKSIKGVAPLLGLNAEALQKLAAENGSRRKSRISRASRPSTRTTAT